MMAYLILFLCIGVSLAFDFLPKGVEIKANKELLAVGETLEINCSTNASGVLEIHHRGNNLSKYVTFRDDHRVMVVIRNVDLQHNGTYHCYIANHSYPISASVQIAYPPSKPRNIRCVSMNLQNMTCTWDLVKSVQDLNLVTNWTLYYKIGVTHHVDERGFSACHNELSNNGCRWFLHDPESTQYSFKPAHYYLIWVEANSHLGSAVSKKEIINTMEIVKITPPRDVMAVEGNKSFSINWKMTFLPTVNLPLVYNISITCSDCIQQQRWQSGALKTKSHLEKTVNVLHLEPFVEYQFTVQVKTKSHGYWSDPTEPTTVKTLQDVPGGSPVLLNSSFTVISSSNKGRQLFVYWQSPDIRLRSGLLTEYKMRIKENSTDSITKVPLSASGQLSLGTDTSYKVDIAASTIKGFGPYSDYIVINKQAKIPPAVAMVTAEANETCVELFWERADLDNNIMGYTVHYCKGELTDNGILAAKCEEDYQWKNVRSDHTNTTVQMTKDKLKSYVFGVSMETEIGSSGIRWCPCIFSMKGAPSQIQELTAGEIQERSVRLSWERLRCMAGQVRVLSFQISWCEGNCNCGQGTLEYRTGGWDLEETGLDKLQSGTEYNVCIRAMGLRGDGPWSKPVTLKTHTPVPWALIVGCTLGMSSLIIIVTVFLWIWRYVKSPLPNEIPIPKAVEEIVYIDYDEDRKTKGDNQYTLIGEEQPLMCDLEELGGKCKLQHLPVSHDSGNDSLSEESAQSNQCEDGITEKMATLDTMTRQSSSSLDITIKDISNDKDIKDMNKENMNNEHVNNEEQEMLSKKYNVRLRNKTESGFFDDLVSEGLGGIVLLNYKPKETRKNTEEPIVCSVQQSDSAEIPNAMNSYSRFCEEDCYLDSGSCAPSVVSETGDSDYKCSSLETLSRISDQLKGKRPEIEPMDSEKKPLISEMLENMNSNNCKTGVPEDFGKQDALEFCDIPEVTDDKLDSYEMSNFNTKVSLDNDVVPYVQIGQLGNAVIFNGADECAQPPSEEQRGTEQNVEVSAGLDDKTYVEPAVSGVYLPHDMVASLSPITEQNSMIDHGYSKLGSPPSQEDLSLTV